MIDGNALQVVSYVTNCSSLPSSYPKYRHLMVDVREEVSDMCSCVGDMNLC